METRGVFSCFFAVLKVKISLMARYLKILFFTLIVAVAAFSFYQFGQEKPSKEWSGISVNIFEKIKLVGKKEVDLAPLKSGLEKELSGYQGEVAIAVTDLKTGNSISIEGDKIYFPASSIKALIMGSVLKDVEAGRYSPSSVDKLLSDMMSRSSNYAANTLMVKTGLKKLSDLPAEIGMTNTVLIHGFSDGDPNVPRQRFGANALTANDANLFWQKLFSGKILGEEMTKKALEYSKLPSVKLIYTPEKAALYHKPGYIELIDSETYIDTGVVEAERFSYVVSFLSRNNPTHQAGADFGLKATKIIYEWFAQNYQ